jgi:flagellar motor switch protein FliG
MGATAQLKIPNTRSSSPLLLPFESGFAPNEMPGLRKAAILIVALGEDLAKPLFQALSERDVRRLTNEITRLGEIPALHSVQVLTEFYGLLATREHMLRGGPEYAQKLLTEAFGAQRAEALLAQVKSMQQRSTGDLAMLQKMDPPQLSKFLENEHPQTVALVLAHLDPKRGSSVLMLINEDVRVNVVKRMAEMREFSPEMVQTVAQTLHRQMGELGTNGKQSYSGYKSVAELLNRLDPLASRRILEDIETNEPQLAISIRNLMFTFDDLLTVPAQSMRELVGVIDKRVLAMALKGAKDDLKAYLFQAMSSRAVEMLKEDMDVMGPVRGRDVSAAQHELLSIARKMESEGKIILKIEADNDLTI